VPRTVTSSIGDGAAGAKERALQKAQRERYAAALLIKIGDHVLKVSSTGSAITFAVGTVLLVDRNTDAEPVVDVVWRTPRFVAGSAEAEGKRTFELPKPGNPQRSQTRHTLGPNTEDGFVFGVMLTATGRISRGTAAHGDYFRTAVKVLHGRAVATPDAAAAAATSSRRRLKTGAERGAARRAARPPTLSRALPLALLLVQARANGRARSTRTVAAHGAAPRVGQHRRDDGHAAFAPRSTRTVAAHGTAPRAGRDRRDDGAPPVPSEETTADADTFSSLRAWAAHRRRGPSAKPRCSTRTRPSLTPDAAARA